MLSKVDGAKKIGDHSSDGKLLNEIDTISKALYMNRSLSRNSNSGGNSRWRSTGKNHLPDSKPKSKIEDPTRKDKKSIWSKTVKAFSHIRNRRFNCCFSLQVHSVEGLPSSFDDVSLCVCWKRRDGTLVTSPMKVFRGKVEFEEQLNCTCTVYGSRNGPHHSAKYEAKHCLLYASIHGAAEVDLGKHRIDLTRLLPLTLEELEEEKNSGKWATSFKLSGKAKGATMNVSFGYTVVGDNISTGNSVKPKQNKHAIDKPEITIGESAGRGKIQHAENLPEKSKHCSLVSSQSVEDIKDLHEILPLPQSELAKSIDVLYQKLDDDKLCTSADKNPGLDVLIECSHPIKSNSCPSFAVGNENTNGDYEDDFSVVEQGVEVSSEGLVEKIDVKDVDFSSVSGPEIGNELLMAHGEGSETTHQEEHKSYGEYLNESSYSANDYDIHTKESILKELESALNCISDLETTAMDSPEDHENTLEIGSSGGATGKGRPFDSDEEVLESDFLRMLGLEKSPLYLSSEGDPESPRERLLRQFEEEAVAGCYSLFNFDVEDEDQAEYSHSCDASYPLGTMADAFDPPLDINFHEGMEHTENDELKRKMKVKMLEDLETEVLMHEWGLNEEAFQQSPPSNSRGSLVDLPCEEPSDLPPLGEGLGAFIQTKNGGFLRSMNPAIFKNAKGGGNLVMQVSTPVVVPAEMGSGIMEILPRLASVGIEKLSMQANKLMPLEDITGKTMQQLAWEAVPTIDNSNRQYASQYKSVVQQDLFDGSRNFVGRSSGSRSKKLSSNSLCGEVESEFVSLEDLAPLAMDKIEALSIEGLRIQSGMSEEDAPGNIDTHSIGEFSALQGRGVDNSETLGLEGTAGLQLLNVKDNCDDVDGLMGLSLTLDEWMRLDSGELDDEELISEHTSKVLAAHHANSLGFVRGGTRGDKKRGKGSGRKCGLLGNNFTVVLMVQLRDPLRNFEPVGAPMLSLIQVERVFIPPKPKIFNTVSVIINNSEEDDDSELVTKIKAEEKPEEKTSEDGIPQFKITDVHVVGIKTERNKKLWGTSTSNQQQKSGSRWLLANGMGKSKKHPFMKTKVASNSKSSALETTELQHGGDTDNLWSISSEAKRNAMAALNPHIRNPNVLFPGKNFRLR